MALFLGFMFELLLLVCMAICSCVFTCVLVCFFLIFLSNLCVVYCFSWFRWCNYYFSSILLLIFTLCVLCCDQVQLCQLSDQRVVVDQLKQITSSLSNLVGANSADDIKQLTVVDMDRYLQLSQTFTDRSRQIEAVYRQANDVMYSVHLCFGGSTIPGIYPGPLSLPSLHGLVQVVLRWFLPLLEKKRQVLLCSWPCYPDCWHTGLLHASLIGSNPHRLKGQRGWAPSWWTSQSMLSLYNYSKSFVFIFYWSHCINNNSISNSDCKHKL